MKRIFLAIALLVMGGISLSTVSSANAMPATASIAEAAEAKSGLQLVGSWKHRGYHRGYGHRYHKGYRYGKHHGRYYRGHGKRYGRYYKGYSKGYCYRHPYNWRCKKYFFKKHKRHYNYY